MKQQLGSMILFRTQQLFTCMCIYNIREMSPHQQIFCGGISWTLRWPVHVKAEK